MACEPDTDTSIRYHGASAAAKQEAKTKLDRIEISSVLLGVGSQFEVSYPRIGFRDNPGANRPCGAQLEHTN